MADWLAPFHMPHMSTAKFDQMRAAYIAEYGYRYSIPGFDDIFYLKIEKTMTPAEELLWSQKKFSELSPERYEELKYMKKIRKEKFLDMLASPQPAIFRSRGALIGAFDDAQDAVSVAAVVGRVAIAMGPQAIKTVLGAPVGWLTAAAGVLNTIGASMSPEQRLTKAKRMIEELAHDSPGVRKARYKKKTKLQRSGVTRGFGLEAAQVTRDVFGYGIALGAIMNLPWDIIFGAARAAIGQTVKVRYPVPDLPHWMRRLSKFAKAFACMQPGFHRLEEFEKTAYMLTSNAAGQLHETTMKSWNPLDEVEDLASVEIQAPRPENILTLEAISEVDPYWQQSCLWPTTGQEWSTTQELFDGQQSIATQQFNSYIDSVRHDEIGFIASTNASQGVLYNLSAPEESGNVDVDYTVEQKAITALLNSGWTFPSNITQYQFNVYMNFVYSCESQGFTPSAADSCTFAETIAGFLFVRTFQTPYEF